MARITNNLDLDVWDQHTDTFDHNELASNWDKIDAHNHDGVNGGAVLAADSVGSTQIANNAVTATELADNAVTANKIQGGAVTSAKLGTNLSLTGTPTATTPATTSNTTHVATTAFVNSLLGAGTAIGAFTAARAQLRNGTGDPYGPSTKNSTDLPDTWTRGFTTAIVNTGRGWPVNGLLIHISAQEEGAGTDPDWIEYSFQLLCRSYGSLTDANVTTLQYRMGYFMEDNAGVTIHNEWSAWRSITGIT